MKPKCNVSRETSVLHFMTKSEFKIAIIVVLAFALNACAKIVSPTGGDKDSVAPEILEQSSEFPATKFNDDQIVLEFNEYINVADLTAITLSPRVEGQPEIKVRGKKIIVKLPDNLNKELTYSLNFNDAVKDYTEQNEIKGLNLVFTAKDKIDSSSVSGTVINAFNHLPEKKVVVGLYPITEGSISDSLVFEEKSLYYTNVDDNTGGFLMMGVAPNNYFIAAFIDDNGNELIDSTEAMGFLPNLITVNDTTNLKDVELFLYKDDIKTVAIDEIEYVSRETCSVKFNRKVSELGVEVFNNKENDEIYLSELSDTDSVMVSYQLTDSVGLVISELKEIGNVLIDTVWVKNDTSLYEQNILPRDDFQENIEQAYFEDYTLPFLIPVKSYNKDSLLFEQKVDTIYTPIETDYSVVKGLFTIKHNWQSDERYRLTIASGGIVGFNNTSLIDTLIQDIKIMGAENYGSLLVVTGDSILQTGNYLYEFTKVGKENKVIEKGALKTVLSFNDLESHNYELVVIEDDNKNGKWDYGNIVKKIEPEKTYIFKGIEIKANWDTSVKLKWE